MEYLLCHQDHPTVEEIYSQLVQEIPTLSKTTVYNTLNLFIEKNIARQVMIEKNEARYDANTYDHGHFKCLNCGKIYDFFVALDDLAIKNLEAFQISEKHFYLQGTCPNCLVPLDVGQDHTE